MNIETKKMLQSYATKIRMGIIESTYGAKAGHPGGSLSSADLFAYLFFLSYLCAKFFLWIKDEG